MKKETLFQIANKCYTNEEKFKKNKLNNLILSLYPRMIAFGLFCVANKIYKILTNDALEPILFQKFSLSLIFFVISGSILSIFSISALIKNVEINNSGGKIIAILYSKLKEMNIDIKELLDKK